MNLYFYQLSKNTLLEDSVEVIEKPQTYYPVERFPKFFIGSYIRKDNIGRLIGFYSDTVVLLESNRKLAIDLLLGNLKDKHSKLTHELTLLNKDIELLENLQD